MNEKELDIHLQSAIEASFNACEIIEKSFGTPQNYQQKSTAGDLVTEIDLKSEEAIFSLLKERYQNYGFIGEEHHSNYDLSHRFTWVVDPLDGTTNFFHGYPMVSVSIALLDYLQPIVAVVHNPIHKELFTAKRGYGAQLNGETIQISHLKNLHQSLLATGFSYDRARRKDNNFVQFFHLTNQSHGVRREGSAALDLAYIAAGRLEGYWEWGLKMWDIAAGTLLIEEAGGKVSNLDQTPLNLTEGKILATNGWIHKELSLELQKASLLNVSF